MRSYSTGSQSNSTWPFIYSFVNPRPSKRDRAICKIVPSRTQGVCYCVLRWTVKQPNLLSMTHEIIVVQKRIIHSEAFIVSRVEGVGIFLTFSSWIQSFGAFLLIKEATVTWTYSRWEDWEWVFLFLYRFKYFWRFFALLWNKKIGKKK